MTARRRKRPSESPFWFDEAAASAACAFFPRHLRHIKGHLGGQPFRLSRWQAERIIRPLFGTKRKDDGFRRFSRAWIEIPRKNGKSLIGAGLALKLLLADGEKGAEIYSAAGNQTQAALVFDVAKAMVNQSPTLSERCRVTRTEIFVPKTDNVYRVVSSDVDGKHGFNPHGVIFDEVHTQPNRDLWDVFETGMGARMQPVMIGLTTAGFANTFYEEMRLYAEAVASGAIDDDSFLPVLFCADPERDDWRDPKVWARVNPGIGESTTMRYIEGMFRKAVEQPSFVNTFKRLHLNMITGSAQDWIAPEIWDAAEGDLDAAELIGRPCYGGLDLATREDFCSLALVFPPTEDDDKYRVLVNYWIPDERIDNREKAIRIPLRTWIDQGYISATPGNITDYSVIERDILDLRELYDIQEVAFDPWNATHISTNLGNEGLVMVEFRQGFKSMSEPVKEMEAMICADPPKLCHDGNPVLRWNVSNAVIIKDAAENHKLDKAKSREKIDGLVATVMALARSLAPDEKKRFVYNDRPLEFV